MKKLFIKFSMMLFVLGMSTNTMWATSEILESLDEGTRTALFTPLYSAQLTGHVSSTGGGKVYVSSTDGEPTEGQFDETSTALAGMAVSMQGMEVMQVPFWAWQKANDGYCFAGWSFADKGTDLGLGDETYHRYVDRYDVSKEMAEVTKENGQITGITELKPLKYDIYATFEPVRISGYSLSGSNTTVENEGKKECTQTVTFTFSGDDIDENDFNYPAIVPEDSKWTVNTDFTVNSETKTGTVTVKFSTTEANHTTSSANLRLTTKAGVSINIALDARTATAVNKDLALYDGKTYKSDLDFLDEGFATSVAACAKPIIKLNRNYNSALTINQNLTLDLCGYTLGGLTINEGKKVTLSFSPYGGTISGAVVNAGTLTLAGGTLSSTLTNNGTLYQNGATINGAVTNNGTMTTTDGVHSQTVTTTSGSVLTINGGEFVTTSGVAIDVKAGATATIKKGTIEGNTYGVQSAGTTTIEKLAIVNGGTKALKQTTGTLTVNCGKFVNPTTLKEGTIVFNSGYFKADGGQSLIEEKTIWRNTTGAEFRENYLFFAGDVNAAKAAGVSVCHIGGTSYSALEDALAYANNTNDKVVIIMDNDYTLPAGFYTLPDNATLIIPMSNEQGDETKTIERAISTANIRSEDATAVWVKPTKFRKLTLSNGVNWDVHGTIEVSCSQYSTDERFTGTPYGPYGQLQLNPGSKMVLQDGSELRAWGYVTGDIEHMVNDSVLSGEIDARRGSMVREQFQMGDWKGAQFSGMGLLEGNTVFPLTTYFIQNVEVPVKYHPGAALSATTAVSAFVIFNISMSANDIQIIGKDGDVAMFLMNEKADAENTWVRKFYDAKHDQQVYEINSGAHIGSMVIPLISSPYLGSVVGMLKPAYADRIPNDLTMNSGQYNLPITNNFKLHLLTGEMDFTQSTELLPGSEVEVDKEGLVYVSPDDGKTAEAADNVNGGFLYVYDASEWGNYAGGAPARLVKYSPVFDGVGGEPTTRGITLGDLKDATINVHGTFDTRGGYVLTSESGANIFSSVEDAGTFLFSETGAYDGEPISIGQVTGATGGTKVERVFSTLKLKNSAKYAAKEGNDEYINTEEATEGTSYCYLDIDNNGGRWMDLQQRGCFTYDDASKTYFIKPQEYVAVVVNDEEKGDYSFSGNDDNTFSDAAGAGRLFINLGNPNDASSCQWWEVEKKDNYYHCIHPDNDTYYEWDKTEKMWKEVMFTIKWKNWDGTLLQTYKVPYGTQAEWLSTNPTREKNLDYTYDFTGWTPALDKVTSNVTYTATFTAKQIKYTITFVQDGGVEIEKHLLAHNEMPVCKNLPTRTGYTLEWSPAIAAVTDDATYTATWLQVPREEYAVTFYDYDGTTVLQQSDVAVGAMPEYTEGTPTGKATWATSENNKEFTYVFDHWSPEIEKVSVTSAKTYTAVYAESPLEYTITFKNEDNSVRETQKYHYGETPVCSNLPTKAATAQYTYKLRWIPQIQTVMEDATYKAEFDTTTNKYTISLKSNPASACTFTGAGTFDYNTNVNNVAVSYNSDEYEFLGWADLTGDAKATTTHTAFTLTEDVTIVANFRYKGDDKVTITWKNWDGSVLGTSEPKKNTATTYTGATPTKSAEAAYTYTFDGWTDSQSNFYKNNQTPKATANATYIAHFNAVPVPDLNISNDNGAPTVLSEAVEYHDLIITSNGATYSGQLVGSNYLTLTGNAHFDLAINAQNHTWYAIAVPWQVDPTSGISVNGRTLTFGKDFDILYYDGSERAAGNPAWKYLELKEGDKTIQPGTLYMIGLMMDAPVVRFTKKEGAPLLTNTTSVSTYASSEATDANWNGIANPTLFSAYVNAGATLGQVYNASTGGYDQINLGTTKLILGQPVFVQAPANKNITVTYGGTYAAAPRRAKATETNEYEVRLSTYGAKYTDRLFVQADEDKEQDRYTIGQDLAKMGVSSKVAQMWINRYNTKLCMNTFAPINGVAEYPLGIYAPKNGEYRLSLATMPDSEASIYLTYDGEAIWNLANGVYAVDLEKGTNNHYGIRVTVKNAPEVATGIDEAIVDSKDAVATKVLIGNQVFIIRGEKVYSMDGQLVK